MKVFAILALALSSIGCATVQPVAPDALESTQTHVIDRNYTLGQVASAYVGQPLVRVKDYWVRRNERATLRASDDFVLDFPLMGPTVAVAAGQPIAVVGTQIRDGTRYRIVQLADPRIENIGFLINKDGTFDGRSVGLLFNAKMAGTITPRPAGVKLESSTLETVSTDRGFVNFEIVYSGAGDDGLNLLYREYTPSDMARPAFTQNLTYSRDAETVRFREIKIKVLEANNERIRYVVEEDGLADG